MTANSRRHPLGEALLDLRDALGLPVVVLLDRDRLVRRVGRKLARDLRRDVRERVRVDRAVVEPRVERGLLLRAAGELDQLPGELAAGRALEHAPRAGA